MAKKEKRSRREEERLMIEEMEKAMAESKGEPYLPPEERKKAQAQKQSADYGENIPQKIHCSRCKTLMENGVCPACGHRIYVPMDKKKQEKIRFIVAGVCIALFVVIFVVGQFLK